MDLFFFLVNTDAHLVIYLTDNLIMLQHLTMLGYHVSVISYCRTCLCLFWRHNMYLACRLINQRLHYFKGNVIHFQKIAGYGIAVVDKIASKYCRQM